MREGLKILLSDRGFSLAILFTLIGFMVFIIHAWSLPPVVPLFYNRPWGTSQLGTPLELFLLLVSSTCVFLANVVVAARMYKKNVLLARILIWVSALISLLATTAVVRTILLLVW